MKKFVIIFLSSILIAGFSGCKGVESCPAADQASGAETSSSEEEISDNVITFDRISQSVYDALRAEWESWDALDELQKAVSSHMPGYCYKKFDVLAECEEFLGIQLSNPLENLEWLEKGTYVGMPEGYNDAPRFNVSFFGTKEGKIEWISVDSGYRAGEIRITLQTQVGGSFAEADSKSKEPLISEDSGEQYVATTAVMAQGSVTYSLRVIGEPGMWEEVRETLGKLLSYFDENSDT